MNDHVTDVTDVIVAQQHHCTQPDTLVYVLGMFHKHSGELLYNPGC